MKNIALVGVGAAAIGFLGTLILTNPSHKTYEVYATAKLSDYLKVEGCEKKLPNFFEGGCKDVINSLQPQILDLFARSTTRQNFLIFSIYKTNIKPETLSPLLPSGLPEYYFESLGIFNNLNTYKIEEL